MLRFTGFFHKATRKRVRFHSREKKNLHWLCKSQNNSKLEQRRNWRFRWIRRIYWLEVGLKSWWRTCVFRSRRITKESSYTYLPNGIVSSFNNAPWASCDFKLNQYNNYWTELGLSSHISREFNGSVIV